MTADEKPIAMIQVGDRLGIEAEILQLPDGTVLLGNGCSCYPLDDTQLATLRKMLDRRARNFRLLSG